MIIKRGNQASLNDWGDEMKKTLTTKEKQFIDLVAANIVEKIKGNKMKVSDIDIVKESREVLDRINSNMWKIINDPEKMKNLTEVFAIRVHRNVNNRESIKKERELLEQF